jgi:hypothetical protein
MRVTLPRLGSLLVVVALWLAPLSEPSATAAPSAVAPPTLVSVQARHVGDVDRVVFGFTGGLPTTVFAEWVDTLASDGSGRPVRTAGTKVLAVYLNGATAHDQDGSTVRSRTAYALPNVITTVGAGDFEGTVTFGLGVQKATSFTVRKLHNPDRVVVDVGAGFPTTTRRVWFVDRDAVAAGEEPSVVPVNRRVPAAAPAAAMLHSLFAGPTPSETAAGLRLVRSGAWSFDDLQIAGGIARTRLTHGCSSGGSTITVADEIMPTLRQFPTVDWVKIYAPQGGTEQPGGNVDSIPTCLEP